MGAELDDAAGVQHGDLVGVAHGGDAVRDEDGGAAAHDLPQVIEDAFFGVGVNAGEGVVEDQDAWIADESARDGGALLLAARERDAALAHERFVLLRERFDVGSDAGGFGSALDLLCGGVHCAEGDVLADGVAEQERLLRHEADGATQRGEREVADIVAVDEQRTGRRVRAASGRRQIKDPGNERDERRLAGARRANDGKARAGGNLQRDTVEHGVASSFAIVRGDGAISGGNRDRAAVVGERQVAEFDVAAHRQVARLRRIGHLRLLNQDLVNADHGSRAALEDVDDPTERDDRPRQLHHVDVVGDEVAGRHAAEQHFAAAEPEHQHDRHAEQQLERRP